MHKNGLKSDPITACRHSYYARQSIRCIKNKSVPVSENLIDKSMEWVFSWPKAKRFARHRWAICPGAKRAPLVRRVAPVLLTGAGWPGFNSAEGRTFAVGELFARAQSALKQSALNRARCVIARHWRVTIRPRAERFARHRRAICPGRKAPCWFNLAEVSAFCSPCRRRAVCPGPTFVIVFFYFYYLQFTSKRSIAYELHWLNACRKL